MLQAFSNVPISNLFSQLVTQSALHKCPCSHWVTITNPGVLLNKALGLLLLHLNTGLQFSAVQKAGRQQTIALYWYLVIIYLAPLKPLKGTTSTLRFMFTLFNKIYLNCLTIIKPTLTTFGIF